MIGYSKRIGALVLRLIVVLALLGCPQIGSAAGTWSVISLPQKPGEVSYSRGYRGALAADAAGDLYVVDEGDGIGQIQMRDAQGNWSILAAGGDALGQIHFFRSRPSDTGGGLAVDPAGNLYVADYHHDNATGTIMSRIQKRDARGTWSIVATSGQALGQVHYPHALAADSAGNLYVADLYPGRIQKRDVQGNWSVIASGGTGIGEVNYPDALAVDAAGTLYVAEGGRIQKRDAQGNWSVIATSVYATALALDAAGNLYVAGNNIQKRDAQGIWSVIATQGTGPGQLVSPTQPPLPTAGLGQVVAPFSLAVDTAGNVYVTDWSNGGRIQKRDTRGNCYENRRPSCLGATSHFHSGWSPAGR